MSKDDSNGGFLSKVVKFVRHPTTSWSDLDTRSADRESEYSKAALKEMIERKRRNDFVRRREFDMLRKIRNREITVDAGQGVRPSFFQSSLPSKPDDRAMTLKKIDEIEAQMSMQWWKTKGPDSLTSTGSQLNTGHGGAGQQGKDGTKKDAASAQTEQVSAARVAQYKETEPSPLVPAPAAPAPGSAPVSPAAEAGAPFDVSTPALSAGVEPSGERAVTPASSDIANSGAVNPPAAPSKPRTGLMAQSSHGSSSGSPSGFSASHFFALDVHEIAQDPEVEEAAIRFANGDDAGAEQGLLDVLGRDGEEARRVDDWLALFDLYRATGQLTPFENQALDFVNRFGRSAPQWVDMPGAVSAQTGKTRRAPIANARAAWVSDAELDAHAVGTLQTVLMRVSQPWVIDWTPLESIDLKSARALLGMFTLWGDQDVELCFLGSSELRALLKKMTPSGRRDIEQLWWELRMAILRVMNRPDEFELTALDFCVTYEVSPPGWEPPRCHFRAMSGENGDPEGDASVLGESVLEQVPSGFSSEAGDSASDSLSSGLNHLGLVELSGEVLGDPQEMLTQLEGRLQGADVLIISCRNLIRVDFSAAGTLLNWVSGHHAEGRLVQFVDVHRLVSAFFHVIGITEYAKVVVRND
ncbi:MAG: STAS domain-containing protein [Burkholderiaceae bacterium]